MGMSPRDVSASFVLPDEGVFLTRATQLGFASNLIPNCAGHAGVPCAVLGSCQSNATMAGQIIPTVLHSPCAVPVFGNSATGLQTLKKPFTWCRTSLPVSDVSEMGLLSFQRWHWRMQKGDRHLPALSKEAIPTCSAGEAVARWRGMEKHWEQVAPQVFPMITSQKGLWMDISNESSPSSTHCGPSLLKPVPLCCVSRSGAYSHQEKLHFMAVQEDGSTKGRFNIQGLQLRALLSRLASPQLLREQISEQKCP